MGWLVAAHFYSLLIVVVRVRGFAARFAAGVRSLVGRTSLG